MWNAVTPKMLAVDSSLKFVGPATANGQFGSGTGANNAYVKTLMTNATTKPAVISFHGYGYWDNAIADKVMFDGDGTSEPNGGIDDIATAAQSVHTTYPTTPMWISEINVNAAWGNDPRGRPGPLGVAWWGSTYIQLAPLNVSVLHQYNIVEKLAVRLDQRSDRPADASLLDGEVPEQRVPESEHASANDFARWEHSILAARRPDGKIAVLIVNRRVDAANPSSGAGLPADVNVALSGFAPTAVTLRQLDSSTSATSGPATVSLTPAQTVPLHFPGYGLAILTLTP